MDALEMFAEAQHEGHIPGKIDYELAAPAERRAIIRRLKTVMQRCPKRAEYELSGAIVRKCIIDLWRDCNKAQRILLDLGMIPITPGIMPESHEQYLEDEALRQRQLYISCAFRGLEPPEPRGFNDKTDGVVDGMLTGGMDSSEWGT